MTRTLIPALLLIFPLAPMGCDGDAGPSGPCAPEAVEACECEAAPELSGTHTCLVEKNHSFWGPCEGCPEVHPCDGQNCGGHGTCELFGGEAVCNCESGYLPEGLTCLPKDCTPDCMGLDCGDDGCGGTCGACDPTQDCVAGTCSCAPQCDGKVCGDDGCGSGTSCGACGEGEACQAGACVPCVPDCTGKVCGDDGCGGSCGDCGDGTACQAGQCVCAPQCDGKECGDDGCGSGTSCGACGGGESCQDGTCVACIPNCTGKACGDDGCGGSCGTCLGGMVCSGGQCVSQGSSCVGSCGGSAPDGCYCDEGCANYGDCCPDVCDACPDLTACGGGGDCSFGEIEDCWGQCSPESSLGDGWCDDAFDCDMFGFDYGDCGGGGGSCEGQCGGGYDCYCDDSCFDFGDCCADVCDFCTMYTQCGCVPDCAGKACGDDGCYGSCGTCQPGYGCNGSFQCEEGLCEDAADIPDCYGICGPADWVGDGICDDGGDYGGTSFNCEEFNWDGGDCEPCVPTCEGKACGDDGCGGPCGDCEDGLVCVMYQCGDALACGELNGCLTDCGEDYACQEGCNSAAAAGAYEQLQALMECLDAAGYFYCMDDTCFDAAMVACQAEMDTCFPPLYDCTGIVDCVEACAAGSSGCATNCYFQGTDDGEAAYDGFLDCVAAACGEDVTDECWDQAVAVDCQAEAGACGVEPCVPDCTDKECGDDGCYGSCGGCAAGYVCEEALCEVNVEDFGVSCESNADCYSGWCISDGVEGAMCSIPCQDDCPEGFDCLPLPPPFSADISICWPAVEEEPAP